MPVHPDDRKHPHLPLMREDISSERRKKPGFPGPRPNQGVRAAFASRIEQATTRLLEEQHRKTPIAGIEPHLVFHVPLVQGADTTEVSKLFVTAGFSIVSVTPKRAVVAFKDDDDLSKFRAKIRTYKKGPKEGINPTTGAPYASTTADVLEVIDPEQMSLWGRIDRIGPGLAKEIGEDATRINPDQRFIVEIELWHPGSSTAAADLLNEVRRVVRYGQSNEGRWLDSYTGDMLLLAKVSVSGMVLDKLLDLDAVAEIDLPPVASFDSARAANLTARDFPRPPRPPANGPRVCIIDSGITTNHPLLAANIGHAEAILTQRTSPADLHGHGTMVGGIAVFGDIRACYENRSFSSPIILFSARVLNDQNKFDDEKLIINQMRGAIETFSQEPYDCRVFNISLGSDEPALGNGRDRQTKWAETLDVIARELKVLLVVSAGNYNDCVGGNPSDAEGTLREYPTLLLSPPARLCDPATSAIAITVGSLAQHRAVELRRGPQANDISRSVSSENQPTLTTRAGPGVNGAIKPELVHYGGNLVFRGFGNTRRIGVEPGTAVMSFSNQPTQRLFAYDVGTSFAAPRVSRLAALLHYELREQLGQDPHPNLLRAILANSASIPDESVNLLSQHIDGHAAIKVCGYGLPDENFAIHSWDRRVTLFAEGQIDLDHFQVFGVPIPDSFRNSSKQRTISVALAYDPPIRRRYDYLGVEMSMFLIRGKSLDEVHAAFKKVAADEDASEAIKPPHQVDILPKATSRAGKYSRKKSTLQRGVFTMKNRGKDYGGIYWLVVRAERRWAPSNITSQDFAVAVTLSLDEPDLYNQVKQRIQQRARARERTRIRR
jgi:Subtilase family